jgi:hypothetical protein
VFRNSLGGSDFQMLDAKYFGLAQRGLTLFFIYGNIEAILAAPMRRGTWLGFTTGGFL